MVKGENPGCRRTPNLQAIDVALIQVSWVAGAEPSKVPKADITIYFTAKGTLTGRSKVYIHARKNLYVFLHSDLLFSDLTMVKLDQAEAQNAYIFSACMAHDRSAPPGQLQHLTFTAKKKSNLMIGWSANALGNSKTKERIYY